MKKDLAGLVGIVRDKGIDSDEMKNYVPETSNLYNGKNREEYPESFISSPFNL